MAHARHYKPCQYNRAQQWHCAGCRTRSRRTQPHGAHAFGPDALARMLRGATATLGRAPRPSHTAPRSTHSAQHTHSSRHRAPRCCWRGRARLSSLRGSMPGESGALGEGRRSVATWSCCPAPLRPCAGVPPLPPPPCPPPPRLLQQPQLAGPAEAPPPAPACALARRPQHRRCRRRPAAAPAQPCPWWLRRCVRGRRLGQCWGDGRERQRRRTAHSSLLCEAGGFAASPLCEGAGRCRDATCAPSPQRAAGPACRPCTASQRNGAMPCSAPSPRRRSLEVMAQPPPGGLLLLIALRAVRYRSHFAAAVDAKCGAPTLCAARAPAKWACDEGDGAMPGCSMRCRQRCIRWAKTLQGAPGQLEDALAAL